MTADFSLLQIEIIFIVNLKYFNWFENAAFFRFYSRVTIYSTVYSRQLIDNDNILRIVACVFYSFLLIL